MGLGTTIPSVTFKLHNPVANYLEKKIEKTKEQQTAQNAAATATATAPATPQDPLTQRSKTKATTINCGLFKVLVDKPLSGIDQVLSNQNIRGVQAFFKRDGVVKAAHALNQPHVQNVAIPTGFSVARHPETNAPMAESDGPPGAVILGEAARKAGKNVVYVVDSQNRGLVEAGLTAAYPQWDEDPNITIEVFDTVLKTDASADDKAALRQQANDLLEKHNVNAVLAVELPARSAGNKYSNMVGNEINAINSARDELLLAADVRNVGKKKEKDKIITAGVGDGGNEAGMGNRKGIKTAISGDEMKSYVPAQYPITAWNSNLGAIALGAVLAQLNGQIEQFATPDVLENVIRATLGAGGVDGCTRDSTPGKKVTNVIGTLVTGVDGKDIAVHRDDLERLLHAVKKEVSPVRPSLRRQFQEYQNLKAQATSTEAAKSVPKLELTFDREDITIDWEERNDGSGSTPAP